MNVRRLLAPVLVAVLLAPLAGAPAGANTIVRNDRDDVAFPLDLESVRVSHGSGRQVFRISTHGPFSNAQIDGDIGWFRLGFDTGTGTFRRSVYLFHARGEMQGLLTDRDGDLIRSLRAARVAPNAVQVRVPTAGTGSTENYRFAVWSVWRTGRCTREDPCVDWLPSSGTTILHDLTAPTVGWGPVPDPSTRGYASLRVEVPFSVADVGALAAGVAGWKLAARAEGAATWDRVETGVRAGSFVVPFTGRQGATYRFRVIAVDEQDNRRTSYGPEMTFPFDDLRDRVTYGPSEVSWIGRTGRDGAFLGTRHLAAEPGAEVTFVFKAAEGTRVCVLGGPSKAPVTADVRLDRRRHDDALFERPTTEARASIGCVSTRRAGPWHTMTVVTDGKGLVVDGFTVG